MVNDFNNLNEVVKDNAKSIQIVLLISKYNIWLLGKNLKENEELDRYKFFSQENYIELIRRLIINKSYEFELNHSSNNVFKVIVF